MSTVLKFRRPRQSRPKPQQLYCRPSNILTHIAALVSTVEGHQIRSTEDLRQAIFILDLANACIRLLLGQLPSGATTIQLPSQSERIEQLIVAARSEVHMSIERFCFEPSTFTPGDCNEVERSKGRPRSL
ncbi:hypothetical protein ACVWXP_007441 [Bradyrhizobium sp. USDA 4463]